MVITRLLIYLCEDVDSFHLLPLCKKRGERELNTKGGDYKALSLDLWKGQKEYYVMVINFFSWHKQESPMVSVEWIKQLYCLFQAQMNYKY